MGKNRGDEEEQQEEEKKCLGHTVKKEKEGN